MKPWAGRRPSAAFERPRTAEPRRSGSQGPDLSIDGKLANTLEAVRCCRVVIGVLVLLHLGLSATPQAVDLLIALGQDGAPASWLGLGACTAWLALNAWFWSGFALSQPRARPAGRVAAVLPYFLAAASLLAVADALRTASASIPAAMELSGGGGRLLAGSAALGAACLMLLVPALRGVRSPGQADARAASGAGRGARCMLVPSVGVRAAGLAGFAADPVRAASILHPASIALLAAAGMMCGGTLLLDIGRRTRVPVLFLAFLLAGAFAALRDRDVIPDNHGLRRLPAGLRDRPDVEAAFLRFLDAAAPPGGTPGGAAAPVVLVASGGGGISAAYWTATVLGDLADASPGFAGRVFAMSGVSGGALGLLTYVAAREGAPECRNPAAPPGAARPDGFRACLQLALGGDLLGPAVGAMLYPDLLQRFLPVPVFVDRAAVLEGAWEARWRAVFGDGRLAGPFLDLWHNRRPWPALLMNGTSASGGGRLIASNLRLKAAHVGGDASDLLALLGGDLPASVAAGSSARFPYIGPLGTFRTVSGAAQAVADGGYFENLGASTLLELLDALDGVARRHGRPGCFIVLQLVNDPDAGSEAAGGVPSQETPWSLLPRGLTGPATVLLRTREARGVSASEALARRVVALGGAYVPVRLGRSPTGRTAPLGWSLSAVARDVIDGQWTPACRERVLAAGGFADGPGPAAASAPADPLRMDVMAMWTEATCHAVDRVADH